jgi:hypothetical protein
MEKVQVESFHPPMAESAPILIGPEDEKALVQCAISTNRRIDEVGTSLAQLYHELGVSLLRLRAMPQYAAHGKWEKSLKGWGISQKRWHQARTIAEGYADPGQLGQVTVQKAYGRAAAKKRARKGSRTASPQAPTGETYQPTASITLRCCDFRELDVAPGSVKAVITDPPWGKDFLPLLPALGEFCAKVLAEDGVAVFFYGARFLPELVEAMKGHLAYQWELFGPYKTPGIAQYSLQFISQYQMALVYGKPLISLRHPVIDLLPDGEKGKDLHAWQHNLAPVRYCVEAFTEPGDLVCDPLAGSFTTAEACHLTGRSCAAGDVDPACLEKAKVRFNRLLSGLYDQLAQDAGFDAAEIEPGDFSEELPT